MMMFCMGLRLPLMCASLMFVGMVFSVIMKMMKSPMRMDVKAILIPRSVDVNRRLIPMMVRMVPRIFARICGCCRSVVVFTFVCSSTCCVSGNGPK